MHPLTSLIVAIALTVVTAGPVLSECGTGSLAQPVGTPNGDPEKDTLGYICAPGGVDRTGSIASMPRGGVVLIGSDTGDAEKDTLGYLNADRAH